MKRLHKYVTCENGGITIDWVVLTAGILGLVLAAATSMSDATKDHANLTSQTMNSRTVGSGF